MPDTEFESKLHVLAYPELQAKVPRLVKSMIGFELLDKDEDETKAVGVYVFRVGDQIVFVPVFYDGGRLSGMSMLYLKDEDLFVPATEETIDHLYSRQPFNIGRIAQQDEIIGVSTSPVFKQLSPLYGKLASAGGGWRDEVVAALASDKFKAAAARLDLENVLLQCRDPEGVFTRILGGMRADDGFGRAVLQYYPAEKLAGIADRLEKQTRKPSDEPVGLGIKTPKQKIKVIPSDDASLMGMGFTAADREEARRTGAVVQDDRDDRDVTKAYSLSTPRDWFSPRETGMHNLVDQDGNVVEAFVSTDVITVGTGTARGTVAVTREGDGGFYERDALLATDLLPEQTWKDMFDKLPGISSDLKRGDWICVVNEDKTVTVPLEVIGKVSDADSASIYVRNHWGIASKRRDSGEYKCCLPSIGMNGLGMAHEREGIISEPDTRRTPFLRSYVEVDIAKGNKKKSDISDYDYESGNRILVLRDADNDKMRNVGWTLYAGKECKVIHLSKDKESTLVSPADQNMWAIQKSAGCRKLSVSVDRGEVCVSGHGMAKRANLTPTDALVHLVRAHGLRKEAALTMIKAASAGEANGKFQVWAVKYAAGYPDLTNDVGSAYNTQVSETLNDVSPVMNAGVGTGPMLTNDIKSTMQAASTGRKEIVDAAILSNLLRTRDIGTAVDDMLGDMTLGLDHVGRILFLLYAHKDEFADRYGEDTVPELEDALENLFKEFGSVIVDLRRRPSQVDVKSTTGRGLAKV